MMPTRKSKEKIYFKDSQYKPMISAYQKGEWGIAGKLLSKLLKDYPGEEELKSLSVDIKIRKQLDSDAKKEAEGIRKKRIRRIIYSVVAIAIVVTVSVIAYDNYSVRVQQEFEAISLQRNLTASFEEAQNFLKAGRAAEAKELLDEISELEEDYPQLSESYEQVLFLLELESQYEKASNQSQEGDFSGSLETLAQIYAIDPNFRDVEILINSIELRRNLSVELLAVAEEAYFREDWSEAILNYEGAAENDPSVIDAEYEARLFTSYIGESESLLVKPGVNQNDVNLAEDYFRKAEVIAPQDDDAATSGLEVTAALIVQNYTELAESILGGDPDAIENLEQVISLLGNSLLIDPDDQGSRVQYDLAKDYIFGLEKYNDEEWEEAVDTLAFLYELDAEYAGGTLRQLLYEAHIGLGWHWFAGGDLDLALEAFQNAETIGLDDPTGRLRIFEARLNVAMVMGELEQYREGVSVFQAVAALSNIKENTLPIAADAIGNIYDAEISSFNGDYQGAFELYEQAFSNKRIYSDRVEYLIQRGDYLVQIAREYFTTVSAIKANSNFSETGEIFLGQLIVIPVLKE
jgi:hypothetical protein